MRGGIPGATLHTYRMTNWPTSHLWPGDKSALMVEKRTNKTPGFLQKYILLFCVQLVTCHLRPNEFIALCDFSTDDYHSSRVVVQETTLCVCVERKFPETVINFSHILERSTKENTLLGERNAKAENKKTMNSYPFLRRKLLGH